jgi:hypothetical protein
MTCYFRHLGEVLKKAGIEVTPENRREIDKVIQGIVGTENKNCPDTWKQVKARLTQNEDGFALALKEAWNRRE